MTMKKISFLILLTAFGCSNANNTQTKDNEVSLQEIYTNTEISEHIEQHLLDVDNSDFELTEEFYEQYDNFLLNVMEFHNVKVNSEDSQKELVEELELIMKAGETAEGIANEYVISFNDLIYEWSDNYFTYATKDPNDKYFTEFVKIIKNFRQIATKENQN